MKIFDNTAVFHIAKGRCVFAVSGEVEGQRMLAAVKGAGKVVVGRVCHFRYADVGVWLDELAVKNTFGARIKDIAEFSPIIRTADEVGLFLSALSRQADHSRFVSNISGRAEEKPKTEPEQHPHEPTEYTPSSLAPEIREGFDISAVVWGNVTNKR